MKPLSEYTHDEIKLAVAARYGQVATAPSEKFNFPVGRKFAESVGYDSATLDGLPVGFLESFTGAGNPQAYVNAMQGETILDLGCGAGLDLCLYSAKVGPTGRLVGLDLSEDMLAKAKQNFAEAKIDNVEFLHAAADAIPVKDDSIDLVTANGIYNLSPDKNAVMREVLRVLRPGGRTIFAEIVLTEELPSDSRKEIGDWFRCIGGALVQQNFLSQMEANGFVDVRVLSLGKNARTGHSLSLCAVLSGMKPKALHSNKRQQFILAEEALANGFR